MTQNRANLTFDEAMVEIVLPCNPLRGPIMMDYLNHGDFRVGLVDQSYEDDTDHFWRMDDVHNSITSFWRIVRTWVTPTCDDMYTWIRDLCKQIIVMHEMFNTGLGTGYFDGYPRINDRVCREYHSTYRSARVQSYTRRRECSDGPYVPTFYGSCG